MRNILKQYRISAYSNLKSIALVSVVLAHITRMYTSEGAILVSKNDICQFITDVIYSFHMPLFMCVSGAIYIHCVRTGKYQSYKKMIQTKAKRRMLPYVFWGIFYVSPIVKALNITGLSFQRYVLFGIIFGADSRHLWYLFTLFLAFVFIGVIDKVISHRWNNQILGILFMTSAIISFFHQTLPTIFTLNYFARYFCFFVFGMLLAVNRERCLRMIKKKRWIVICSLGIFTIAFVLRNFQLPMLFTSLSGIVISFSFVIFNEKRLNDNAIVRFLNNYSMGIYIIHPMIIYLWFYLVRDKLNVLVSCCCAFAISIGMSFLGVVLFRKAKLQYLIGE